MLINKHLKNLQIIYYEKYYLSQGLNLKLLCQSKASVFPIDNVTCDNVYRNVYHNNQ